ncbi:MAG TPA: sulfotransferase [Pirellulales bacterium]
MAVASPVEQQQATPGTPPKREWWRPYFWTGMNAGGWWRLLARNHFRVGLRQAHVGAAISGWSLLNSFLGLVQRGLFFNYRAARTPIEQPPIFVLGHWRSGTTLLHEMLVLDERHTSPSTYACLAPTHFLLTEDFARRWLNFLLPTHRPMDNMPTGWDRPQEEEFALCNLGLPSPYLTIAFPNEPPYDPRYLTLEGLTADELERWKFVLLRFLRQVTFRTPKRLVLKNPPHTSRIRALLEMFPDARFVHIVRDPLGIYNSTNKLWHSLYVDQGLQTPRFAGLDEYIFSTLEMMYDKFERDRGLLAPGRLCELRYEDLVRDPAGELKHVYDELGLGGFDELRPKLDEYLASMTGYQTNRYAQAQPELRARIAQRWGRFFRRFGYEM